MTAPEAEAAAPERQRRTYEWEPIVTDVHPLTYWSGLDYFRALIDGTLPPQPITETIGWTVEAVDVGYLRVSLEPGAHLLHGAGIMHGGVLATLLDSVMSGAVMSTLPRGRGCTTLQLSVNHIQRVRPNAGRLIAEGRTYHVGGQIATANGTVHGATGRLHAHGTETCLLFDLPDPNRAGARTEGTA